MPIPDTVWIAGAAAAAVHSLPYRLGTATFLLYVASPPKSCALDQGTHGQGLQNGVGIGGGIGGTIYARNLQAVARALGRVATIHTHLPTVDHFVTSEPRASLLRQSLSDDTVGRMEMEKADKAGESGEEGS